MVPDKAFGLNGTANLVDVTRCGKEFDGTTVILAFHNRKTFGSNKLLSGTIKSGWCLTTVPNASHLHMYYFKS
jgi:hypothetical protein